MGRVGINIDKEELTKAINDAENSRTFKNESELFTFICSTPYAKTIKDELGRSRELTSALIYNRVKLFKIPLKTVKGKKGNPNIGVRLTPEEKSERVKNRPHYLQAVQHVRTNLINHYRAVEGSDFKALPPNRENLVKRYAKGNVRAAIKLKCLECCCGEAAEAARCTVYGCPLYLLNPFLKPGVSPEQADGLVGEVDDSNEGEE